MRLEWLQAALADRDAIYDFISADSRRAAIRTDDTIEQQADRLEQYPHLGRIGRLSNTRELVISGTSYVAIYRIEASRILVLRVLHAAQSWPDSIGD